MSAEALSFFAVSARRAALAISIVAASTVFPIFQAPARDLSSMNADEIKVLQQRLTDAGCYKGPIDGTSSNYLGTAKKTCPDQEPILRVETGMHIASIEKIGTDAQCRLAATGSDDKTVRLWSMPDGKLLRTQRLPIGSGDYGKVYAVAVSPDGALVAAGGADAQYEIDSKEHLYIFDAATGQSIRRIGGIDDVIHHLAFSPDGSRLAASLGSTGIRVFDVTTGRELMADRDFKDDSRSLAFGPDGSLYASGEDGFVRRYDASLKRTAKVATQGGNKPYAIAIDPGGRRLAVTFEKANRIDILDGFDLHRIGTGDTAGIPSNSDEDLYSVTWSGDGSKFFVAGRYQKSIDGGNRFYIRPLTANGGKAGPDIWASTDTIYALTACGDAIAFASGDPVFGLVQRDFRVLTLGVAHTATMENKLRDAFTVSADGTRLRFGLGYGAKRPVLFDLAAGAVTEAPRALPELAAARISGLPVTGWESGDKPKLGGRLLSLDTGEFAQSLAVRADRSGFILGTEYWLRSYDSRGELKWQKPGPSIAWGANLTKDDRVIIVAYGDGTLRWLRSSDGQELLALFVDSNSGRFVTWTPTGYYMASPGGEDLIGWQVNRGWNQQADFFPASRFRDRFNRPDIVRLVLETLDEGEAVKRANQAAGKSEVVKPLAANLPPVLTILAPAAGTHFSGTEVSISYSVRSPSGQAIDKVEVLIDGRAVQARGFERVAPQPASATAEAAKLAITVQVPQHDVEIGLFARSGELVGNIASVKLGYDGARALGADLLKPKLYILAFGVSDYVDPDLRLGYAAKDAKDFAASLQAQSGGLYGEVVAKVYTDHEVTRDSVVDGLEWLEKQVTSRDVGILYIAGHGYTDEKQNYWFLPADATPEKIRRTAISQDDLRRSLQGLAGKAVLFLDTCHANQAVTAGSGTRRGTADINSVVNDLSSAENGVVTFASSTGREVSVERDDWKNGAFTKALVEALGQGKADLLGTGNITVSELDAYLANRVKILTDGVQHPVMTRPNTVPDFPIAIAKR